MQLAIELLPFEPFVERIWDLRQALTSDDAWYVAVAEALHFPLATRDERLANATGPKCQFLLKQTS
jgi:predicted nucleic acid-binding protein